MKNKEDSFLIDGQERTINEMKKLFSFGNIASDDLELRQKKAIEILKKIQPIRAILDVGCYAGSFVKVVHGLFPEMEVVGCDSFEDHIRAAKALYPDLKNAFEQGSVYSLSFPNEVFDCVSFQEVLEHLDRPIDALREINRVLRPNGHLILSTPNAVSISNIILGIKIGLKAGVGLLSRISPRVFWENTHWNRHLIEFHPGSLLTIFHINGFKVVDLYYVPAGKNYSFASRILPGMADILVFHVQKRGPAPQEII